MMQRDFPEDWVHDSGRLVVVGSAAHPFPVSSFPTCVYTYLVTVLIITAWNNLRSEHEFGRRVGARQVVLTSTQ